MMIRESRRTGVVLWDGIEQKKGMFCFVFEGDVFALQMH